MKFATVRLADRQTAVLVEDDGRTLRDLSGVTGAGSVLDVIENWQRLSRELRTAELPMLTGAHALLAPIPAPRRNLFAVGKNYREHVNEFGRSGYDSPERSEDLPTKPVVFSKATTAVTGPFDLIELHAGVTSEVDYEAELAVIIGTGGRAISTARAMDHVWGYTVVNDVTARDLQRDHKQWLLGKSLDTHAPMGPWAVSADEIEDVTTLRVTSSVNGEPRQDAVIADLIFSIPELIATISAGITLMPGDVVATGTPAGVGIGFDPPRFLQAGDVVECSVERIGTIRNTVGCHQ
ncbi:fumarylacetoacetate hydrolase family protein [uncultured Jatrophihabitans sp.]|uniref:fumarylacetoacetate hydrolase family protein n=1 Tax=uncultured Jatrophihabitans sp. TaxID=1610747 RepID=UPI0035CA9D37